MRARKHCKPRLATARCNSELHTPAAILRLQPALTHVSSVHAFLVCIQLGVHNIDWSVNFAMQASNHTQRKLLKLTLHSL